MKLIVTSQRITANVRNGVTVRNKQMWYFEVIISAAEFNTDFHSAAEFASAVADALRAEGCRPLEINLEFNCAERTWSGFAEVEYGN